MSGEKDEMVSEEVGVRYWVYYSRGGCNYGDHSWGLEGFGTEGEARAFVGEGKKIEPEMSWAIIRGELVGED